MKSRKACSRKQKQGFDVLAFKERVQAEIYEVIKDLTPSQQADSFRKAAGTGPFAEWWKKAREEGARRRGAKDPAA